MTKWLLWAGFCLLAFACPAQTVQPLFQPHQTFFNLSGNPCSGCSLYSYAAGTTTPQATYTDASGATPNTNPIVLDAAGGASVWMGTSAYKFALLDTYGTTIWTVDQVVAPFAGGQGPFLPLSGGTLTGAISGPAMEVTGRNVVFPGQGLSFQWNLSDTAGEGDFVNYKGLGPGGFSWFNTVTGTAVGSPIMNLSAGGILNTTGGYLYNGAAPNNHFLLGNGTAYVDASAMPASVISGLYYQTVFAGGTPLTQESLLNFDSTLSASSADGGTNVGLPTQGTAGSCTYCSATFDAYGRETSYSSGTAPDGITHTGQGAGCNFSSDGNGLTCSATVTLGNPMPDTDYTALCAPQFSSAVATTASAMPSMGLSWSVASTTTITIYEALNNGTSTGYGISPSYGVTVYCIAHHS